MNQKRRGELISRLKFSGYCRKWVKCKTKEMQQHNKFCWFLQGSTGYRVQWPKASGISIYLSHSLADHWGTTVDFTTSFLHSSQFSAFCSMIFHSRPVHSLMLSCHCFLCLPLRLPPWTVPCRIVSASPDDCVTWLYHLSLCFFYISQEVFHTAN